MIKSSILIKALTTPKTTSYNLYTINLKQLIYYYRKRYSQILMNLNLRFLDLMFLKFSVHIQTSAKS